MAIETRMTSAAEVLFEARRRAGMTQIELADRGCVAPSVISQVERGRRNPSLATLQRLVAGTGYTVGLTLYRPDPYEEQLVGPIGRRVLARRLELLRVLRGFGFGRVWVSGLVARGAETWDTALELVIEGFEGHGREVVSVLAGVFSALGDGVRLELLPQAFGQVGDVLLGDARVDGPDLSTDEWDPPVGGSGPSAGGEQQVGQGVDVR